MAKYDVWIGNPEKRSEDFPRSWVLGDKMLLPSRIGRVPLTLGFYLFQEEECHFHKLLQLFKYSVMPGCHV